MAHAAKLPRAAQLKIHTDKPMPSTMAPVRKDSRIELQPGNQIAQHICNLPPQELPRKASTASCKSVMANCWSWSCDCCVSINALRPVNWFRHQETIVSVNESVGSVSETIGSLVKNSQFGA
jgi:hypothetical protein